MLEYFPTVMLILRGVMSNPIPKCTKIVPKSKVNVWVYRKDYKNYIQKLKDNQNKSRLITTM